MKYLKGIRSFAAALLLLLPAACGGGGDDPNNPNNPTPGNVSISIAPMTANVETGKTATLTVSPQNTAVLWPTLSAAQGSYTTSGNVATYTAPATAIEFDFTVMAAADPTKTAKSTIKVVPSSVTLPAPQRGDVYVAGSDDWWRAVLWKNGVAQYLAVADGTDSSRAYSVFVV